MWFGLLFFAAITSSLAMGQPIMALLQEEYGMNRPKSALAFGLMLLPLALPVALTHSASFFDDFDFWAGTFMLVVFALGESILFAWVFGMDRAWNEITSGAELQVPRVFYFVIKYITPAFLIVILLASIFKPAANWTPYIQQVLGTGPEAPAWQWADDGTIGKLLHVDIEGDIAKAALIADDSKRQERLEFLNNLKIVRNIDRLTLAGAFAFLSTLVYFAWRNRAARGGVQHG